MSNILRRVPRTSQPQGAVEIDRNNPAANRNWSLVCVPGVTLFGSANPVGALKTGTAFTTNQVGRSISQTATLAANCGFSLGNNAGLQSTISSGVGVAKNVGNGSLAAPIWRTGSGASKNGDFYIDFTSNKLRLVKANVALILQSSNTVVAGRSYAFAWSYNAATGRARIALDGVITSGTSVQTLVNSGESLITGYDTSVGSGTYPSEVSFFALSPDEVMDDGLLLRSSQNPWQLFKPQARSLWIPGAVSAGGAATAIPIGVQATGATGSPTATGAANATPSGVQATAGIGVPTAVGGASIPATALPAGVAATGAVGAPTGNGASIAYAGGVAAFTAVGTPVAVGGASGAATALPAGVQAAGSVGTITATGAGVAYAFGVQSIAFVGAPHTTGDLPAFVPSIHSASVPAQSYTATSPAISYTAVSPVINYTATSR